MTGPDDLIRRGDVLRIFEPETSMVRRRICDDVRAIPSVSIAAPSEVQAERDAALAGAVKVRQLAWIDNPDQSLDCWMVDNFGLYQITDELVLFTGHESTGRKFDTLDAAKTAAQADYEARIIASVQPDTEALERATDAAYTEGFEHGERSDLRVENERMREALTLLATRSPRVDISADEFLREFVHPTARAALQPEVSHDRT